MGITIPFGEPFGEGSVNTRSLLKNIRAARRHYRRVGLVPGVLAFTGTFICCRRVISKSLRIPTVGLLSQT